MGSSDVSSAQVALITGGASGMGLGLAEKLVSQGWNITIVDFNEETGKAVAEKLGPPVFYIKGNVARYEDQSAAFVATFKKWGHIDLVWANAGIGDRIDFLKPVEEDTSGAPPKPDAVVIDICLYGVVYSAYLALHFFRKNPSKTGKLVMTSSMAGIYPAGSISLYGAAKHGVVGLTRSLAQGLKSRDESITVNCLCPGLVPTALPGQAILDAFPKNRLTPISTIVRAVEEFIADDSITGQAAECSGEAIHYRPAPTYSDENAEYLAGGKFVKDIKIDADAMLNNSIASRKKLDELLGE
jgi:15-hydroxyprostaglandin dehydrogenase (NAD)